MKNVTVRFWNDHDFNKVDEYSYKILHLVIEDMGLQQKRLLCEMTISGYNDTFIKEKKQIQNLFKKID